jgi:hypothetical protein
VVITSSGTVTTGTVSGSDDADGAATFISHDNGVSDSSTSGSEFSSGSHNDWTSDTTASDGYDYHGAWSDVYANGALTSSASVTNHIWGSLTTGSTSNWSTTSTMLDTDGNPVTVTTGGGDSHGTSFSYDDTFSTGGFATTEFSKSQPGSYAGAKPGGNAAMSEPWLSSDSGRPTGDESFFGTGKPGNSGGSSGGIVLCSGPGQIQFFPLAGGFVLGQSGVNNHGYPLHLGGSAVQPVVQLANEEAHVAFHRYLRQAGFPYGDAGRAAWARLTEAQRRIHIIRALRAAGVPMRVIRANIGRIVAGARPGILTARPAGFPGGRIPIGAAVGVGVAIEFFANPSVASAAEPRPRTWRDAPGSDVGRVEMMIEYRLVDFPRFWNLTGRNTLVASDDSSEGWLDLGEMTVAEARQLEGLADVWEAGGLWTGAPPVGYYRQTLVFIHVRLTPE